MPSSCLKMAGRERKKMYRLIYSSSETGYQEESGVFDTLTSAVRYALENDPDAEVIYLGTDEVLGKASDLASEEE